MKSASPSRPRVCSCSASSGTVVLIGSDGEPEQRAARGAPGPVLTAGPFHAETPVGWRALDEPSLVTGLALRQAASAAPSGHASDGAVTIGLARRSADNPALLPREFLEALGLRPGVVPKRETVRVGAESWAAYRYAGLDPPGASGPVTAYVVPTDTGVATVACMSPSPEASIAAECRTVADSLTASPPVRAYPLGPSPAYASRLEASLIEAQSCTGGRAGSDAPRDNPAAPSAPRAVDRCCLPEGGTNRSLGSTPARPMLSTTRDWPTR